MANCPTVEAANRAVGTIGLLFLLEPLPTWFGRSKEFLVTNKDR